jgi:DNA-binding PucR family transcriptional regulator
MRTGSIKEVGDALFLHRNTVFKRLRSFHELTGLDVTVPRDAVIAMVLISNEPQGANEH